jgi:transaldolase
LLRSGTLKRYIEQCGISGLTSNPSLFEKALRGDAYDAGIHALDAAGLASEDIFFSLALEDLREAADLFRPTFDASGGADGWVSLEVSPLLADNTAHTIRAASHLHDQADRANLCIKIPGTLEGLRAVEEVVFDGVPVNVTLLFSREHYLAASAAHMRGIERRLAVGLDPGVTSFASMFVSRWDAAVREVVSPGLHNRLGIAMAMRTYRAHRELLATDRWQRLAAAGARPQRLLWASTGAHDPATPDTLYLQALRAADTLITVPEKVLLACAGEGRSGAAMPADAGRADAVLAEFRREGVDDEALARRLQREGVEGFARSWHAMLTRIRQKCAAPVDSGT